MTFMTDIKNWIEDGQCGLFPVLPGAVDTNQNPTSETPPSSSSESDSSQSSWSSEKEGSKSPKGSPPSFGGVSDSASIVACNDPTSSGGTLV
jgi:hypothetical protein